MLGTLVGTVHLGLEKDFHGHAGIELGAGLLDNELLDDSLVDERGAANDIGLVIEIGVRVGVDYEL